MRIPQLITTLALVASFGSSHCAVHLSPSKTGSAIIVPFYTVSNQMNTLLSLNNTTDDNKAVKIHFKEAKSGDLLASFNVYLKGQDMWTMAMGQVPSIDGGRIRLVSNNQSCTIGFPNNEDIPVDEDWLWENGTIEIIEMGTLLPTEAPLVHRSCELINEMWQTNQAWSIDSESLMSEATGGLHAEVTLMDVEQGHSANIPIIHMDGFYGEDNIQHTAAGESTPNLSTGTNDSLVISNGQAIETTWPTGYEAVSALLMKNTLTNEFNTEKSVAAQTEFIISLPTLHYHLNDSRAPFSTYPSSNQRFWFPTLYTNKQYFNRSGEMRTHFPCPDCSPIPPEVLSHSVSNFVFFRLPAEFVPGDTWVRPVPMLTIENFDYSGNTLTMLTESDPNEVFEPWSFINGKIKFILNTPNDRGYSSHDSTITHQFIGMPVVGFSFTRFSNANAQPGLLAQYAFVREHFGKTKVELISE